MQGSLLDTGSVKSSSFEKNNLKAWLSFVLLYDLSHIY